MTRPAVRAAPLVIAAALASGLGGCVSLLPKAKPVQLYRFSYPGADASAAAPPAQGLRTGLALSHIDVQRAAAGDRLLAVTGAEAAFIDGARWLSPASVLLEAEVKDAFQARSARVRLLDRAEFAAAAGVLRLDVPSFEVRYAAPGQAPVVRVAIRATLTGRSDVEVASREFVTEAPATQNRVSAIVDAYGRACAQATGDLVAWTDVQAALIPPPRP